MLGLVWTRSIRENQKESNKKHILIFWNQARPLKPKELIEIHGVGTCLNPTHPSKPREIKKKRFWEIFEPDRSVVIIEFLKKMSIYTFWKRTCLSKSQITWKKTLWYFSSKPVRLKARRLSKKKVLGLVWTRPNRESLEKSKKKRFWEPFEADRSVIITEFLKQIRTWPINF